MTTGTAASTLDVVVSAFAGYDTPANIQQRENKRRDRRMRVEAAFPDRVRLTKHPAQMASTLEPVRTAATGTSV